MLKNSQVLHKKVLALVSSTQSPTGLKPIFKFSIFKSINAKYFIISLNNHSTLIHTLLIVKLNSSYNGLRLPQKGACKWTHKG